MALTVFVALFAAALSGACASECAGHYYRELGCAPAPATLANTCPQYYECPQLHPIPDKCYYRGRAYDNGALLPSEVVLNRCSVSCYCNLQNITNGTKSVFECAAVDCVEDYTSGESGDTEEECVATYKLEDCCSSGKVCGKDDIAALATCTVNDVTYREGQQFFPSGSCQVCICTRQFNGSFAGAEYCSDINCGLEIHYQSELADNCAPVLLNGDSCCPHKWECPDNSTQIVKAEVASPVEARCRFGDRSLRVGDRVLFNDTCTQCSCAVPPLVTCVQQADCK